jgi:FkbM family methyltransferase
MINSIKKIIKKIFNVVSIDISKIILEKKKRFDKNYFEEAFLIEEYFRSAKVNNGVMLDVGAHFGESFVKYLNDGWKVYAFEPDPNPLKIKELNALKSDNLRIYDMAISNQSNKIMPFYSSDESTGISSLSAFTSGHKLIKNVKTITIKDFVELESVGKIDFLKIDTEGHDFFVLKGLPWEDKRIHPTVILCEFEDKKTNPLGYSYSELGDYLLSKDYVVYISEWYPIERYGVKHKWRKLTKYPAKLDDENGWGNYIAIKNHALVNKEELFNRYCK